MFLIVTFMEFIGFLKDVSTGPCFGGLQPICPIWAPDFGPSMNFFGPPEHLILAHAGLGFFTDPIKSINVTMRNTRIEPF